ncbi:MAG: UDP-N-acetylmuramoyl-L-alanine--D-glutamate ligase [Egibacteraceae bacterium]
MIPWRRPLVVGLGRSGVAMARALLDRGLDVRLADARDDHALATSAAPFFEQGADVRLGGLGVDILDGRDLVVTSPGVPPRTPLLKAARARGLPVWSEPELAWRLAGGQVRLVVVTGTNGKTTTTELIAACLGAPAAGNIGTPLVELLARPDPPPLVVAELSSFQLQFTHSLRPDVAVLLNVAVDHLDWHGTAAAYRAAKARSWASQRPGDAVVVNADDGGAVQAVHEHPPAARVVTASTAAPGPPLAVGVRDGIIVWRPPAGQDLHGQEVPVARVADLALTGPHNVSNVCAAVAASACAGADPTALGPALTGFAAGPHRLERVACVDGVTWVNDSKATNPHAAAAALRSFGSVVWIAGGLDKDLDFDGLAGLLPPRVRATVTIGSCGPSVARMSRRAGVETTEAGTLDVAVEMAARLARPGDTVLLAPAAASMDQFTDYAARGQAFRELVARLRETRGARR